MLKDVDAKSILFGHWDGRNSKPVYNARATTTD